MAGSNDDILRVLGRLEEKVDGVGKRLDRFEREFTEERRSSSESRHRLHERIDEQSIRITEVEKTVVAAGAIAAQQRDVIAGLTATIDHEIKPTINQVKDITRLGKTAALIFASLGFTAGGMFIYFSETVVPPLRKWLRID
ncbi:membrane protein [Pseudorhizobium halotolerans]|uniref:Membrane protein n=1 Tax=Pseudorhizobium halotolerans TaxID=1233081 RepID=A0ABN7JKY5_9HYPH|nr:hypothetical protein [Pseudorhizobium halotolerans]CAD7036241.1 membrane protein [Pseudorhizobium halotolerans]